MKDDITLVLREWIRYADRGGNRITREQWSGLITDNDYKRVAWEEVGPWVVSTVWLGYSNVFDGEYFFETMVFKAAKRGPMDWGSYDMERYCALEEAKKGHLAMVEKWRDRPPETVAHYGAEE